MSNPGDRDNLVLFSPVILSQYECASNAVSGGTCFGRVYDLLAAGVRNFQRMPHIQVCRYGIMVKRLCNIQRLLWF